MDNRSLNKDMILENFGGTNTNSLNDILQNTEDDHELDTINSSQYYSVDSLPSDICNKTSNLLILSLNAQSILAKFSSFEVMINVLQNQGVIPDVILIQESWLENDNNLDLIQLDGYQCKSQGYRISKHGGLITYVRDEYDIKVLNICPASNIWEGLFVELTLKEKKKTKFIIGNIYKPPRNNNNYYHLPSRYR